MVQGMSGIAAPKARSRPARRIARASLPCSTGFGLRASGFGFAPSGLAVLAEIVELTVGAQHRNRRISKYPPIAASRIPPSGRSRIAPPVASPQPNQIPVACVDACFDEDERDSERRLGST